MPGRVRLRMCSSFSTVVSSLIATFVTLPCTADQSGPVVWYRASQECPSGSEFLSSLSGSGPRARLAQAGDHIDFVVTLQAANAETLGRLERQTQGGAVAIRELSDASCQRVADALALSLTLALQPGAAPLEAPGDALPTSAEAAQSSVPGANAAVNQSPAEPPQSTSMPASPITKAGPPRSKDMAVRSRPAASSGWWLGAQGGAITGLAPKPLARAAAFIDREGVLRSFAPHLSFRLAVVGVLGSSSTEVGSVPQWLLGGRLEGCPWSWGGTWSLRPCVVFELGATGARGQRATGNEDAGLWAAPGAALRGGPALARWLRLEAEAGALFPLLRHDVYAGSQPLYRAEIASFHAGLALSLVLP